ncbi:ABC-F family ATP-binding cassette domain-containing protein [Filifactor villosus]|uniref:ABC-F family ATP-binding cassette domain-containing protein n=1 Tax=Filifactor villosus TaxID=29374 RepID=A0ABV9QLG5_9FIRM
MITLALNNISKSYGVDTIIKDITFSLNEYEKVGLVGINGAGKSTLFKIIAGELSPDTGNVFLSKDTGIGYLEQNISIRSDNTLYEEVLDVFHDVMLLERELRTLEQKIAKNSENSTLLDSLMKQYSQKSEEFSLMNGYSYNSEAKGILIGLGFSEEEMNKKVNTLSGGEMTRLMLSKLLLKKPNLLLLDEPTNHLDMNSVQWLEVYLKLYKGNVIVISHDRYFLDQLIGRTLEIRDKTLFDYRGNYSYYLEKKDLDEEVALKNYKDNQAELKRQRDIIRQLRAFGREKQIKRARSREKLLAKMERIDKPRSMEQQARISFSPSVQSGYEVMHARGLQKSYGNRHLFSNVCIDIYRGEKVALIGPNGSGKTTLFQILLGGETSDSGEVDYGTNVQIAYFDQTRSDLDERNTVIEEVWQSYPHLKETELRNMLAAFLFMGDDVFKLISSLSGGEKSRISLLKLMLSSSNFLFLDEPTNHLDIQSKEILEDALTAYEGTLFFISHDRYFLNKVADRILVLTENGLEEYLGNYDYYQEKLAEQKEAMDILQTREVINKTQVKQQKKKDKEKEKELRSIKKKVSNLEESIANLEERLAFLDGELCREEIYSSPTESMRVQKEKEDVSSLLEETMSSWEELLLELEQKTE